MPRQPRLDVPGLVHHVMARGIEGREIFRDDRDRETFLERLGEVATAAGARVYAWCLLPNHFHLLVRPEDRPLSWVMRRVMTGHAVRFNLRHERKGHVFQNRYKSIVVEEEPYFLELVRYIHLNAVRAGLVESLEELDRYPFAGHSVLVGAREAPWQAVDEVLVRFGAQRGQAVAAYRRFIAAGWHQGRRSDLTGGGLVRSAGGLERLARRRRGGEDAWDERVLGSGAFVEEVWRAQEVEPEPGPERSWTEVLAEVARAREVEESLILGASRERRVARARREFLLRAFEEAGMSVAELARLTGRTHGAVHRAVDKAREERARAE